jgi:hypothetical protein
MTQAVPISKDDRSQMPVPTAWRHTLSEIVDAFRDGDFVLARGIAGVRPISLQDSKRIAENIRDYGATLTGLPETAWQTSVCQWLGNHWEVMVDLYTADEGRSDLILHTFVYEDGSEHVFEVHSVYVP